MRRWSASAFLLTIAAACATAAVETIPIPDLPPQARLALCGDSITEQMLYTRYVEYVLLASAGRSDVQVFQFGWAGENADQFAVRVRRGDLDALDPTVVTMLYGANDVGGMDWQPWMETMWRGRCSQLVAAVAQRYPATAGRIVICGPTVFETPDGGEARGDAALERLRGINRELAGQNKAGFADVRRRMQETRAAAGTGCRIAGRDGVHPGPEGHLAIASEILRALGWNGEVGSIDIDMAGEVRASAGHQVLSSAPGRARLASSRWPFCWERGTPDAVPLQGIRTALPYDRELNRLILRVSGLRSAQADVTWSGRVLRFSAVELREGVNLARAFADTPFDSLAAEAMRRIAERQLLERDAIKRAGSPLAEAKAWTAEDLQRRAVIAGALARALVPVEHELSVVPVP